MQFRDVEVLAIFMKGAQLTVKTICCSAESHSNIWRSSSNLRNEGKSAARVNINLSSSIILTGKTFASMEVIKFC